jgi:hypothetical protein
VGFTPRTIRRVPQTGLVSSSGFLAALPLDAKLKNGPVRGPHSIHILKHPHLGPQLTASDKMNMYGANTLL